METRQREADRQAKQVKVDIERRLDHMQAAACKGPSSDPDYLRSLREAMEESSEEEEGLARRALASKREGLDRLRAKRLQKAARGEGSENEDSRLYPQRRLPVPTRQERVVHPWERRGEDQVSPLPSLVPQALPKMRKHQRGSLDTSEEEEEELVHTHEQQSLLLDILDEQQLLQVKALVDKRIAEAGHKQQSYQNKGTRKRSETGDDLRIDDDFYDARFLDLVYEMESRGDQSRLSEAND